MNLSPTNLMKILIWSFLIAYLGISFVEASFNFTLWDVKLRGLTMYITVGLAVATLLLADKVTEKTTKETTKETTEVDDESEEEFPNSVIHSAETD